MNVEGSIVRAPVASPSQSIEWAARSDMRYFGKLSNFLRLPRMIQTSKKLRLSQLCQDLGMSCGLFTISRKFWRAGVALSIPGSDYGSLEKQ